VQQRNSGRAKPHFHTRQRPGQLQHADIAHVTDPEHTIFDPADFKDRATYADPHRYPTGARTTVLVNGVLVVENARHTGATPGMVLRRAPDGTVG